jgi:hypothetical protein
MLTIVCFTPRFCCCYVRYKAQLSYTAALKLVNTLVQFAPSLLVSRILKYIGKGRQQSLGQSAVAMAVLAKVAPHVPPTVATAITKILQVLHNEGFKLSLLLFLCLSAKTIVENQYFDATTQLGAEVRGALSTAVYRKALKLSPGSRANNTVSVAFAYQPVYPRALSMQIRAVIRRIRSARIPVPCTNLPTAMRC